MGAALRYETFGTSLVWRPLDEDAREPGLEREFFVGNLLVRIHLIIVMIKWEVIQTQINARATAGKVAVQAVVAGMQAQRSQALAQVS